MRVKSFSRVRSYCDECEKEFKGYVSIIPQKSCELALCPIHAQELCRRLVRVIAESSAKKANKGTTKLMKEAK